MFRRKTLEGILSAFDRVSIDLSRHVTKKTQEQLDLLVLRSEIDDEIGDVASEVDRAHRVLAKVQELVA